MDSSSQWSLREGADVYGADGDKVGKIVAANNQYIVVEKGFFFPTDYYIPVSAIESAENDNIYLSVTKDEALNRGWDVEPTAAVGDPVPFDDARDATVYDASGTATYAAERDQLGATAANAVGATGYMGESATTPGLAGDLTAGGGADRGALDAAGYDAVGERPFAHDAHPDQTHVHDGDTLRIPVHEEELTATKRTVEQGQVRIGKDVVAEERTLEVPVTEERVQVTRRVVDRDATGADATAFEEGVIEVPLRREEVELQKRVRVAEEVEVAKEAVQRTERVGGTVRREEVVVEDATVEGNVTGLTTQDRGTTSGGTL